MNNIRIKPNSSVPKVQQIERQIRQKIESGELPAGQKLPSMINLADQLGVSLGIVKLALRTLTAEGVLQSKPKVGVFVADAPPVRNVALVLPTIELEQIPRMVRAARTSLPADFQLVIEASSTNYDGQIDLFRNLNKNHISGVILFTPALSKYGSILQEALDPAIPCVQCIFELDGLQTDCVASDGFVMGQSAVQYLIDKGHHKIGLVSTGADGRTISDRIKGMDAALKQIGQSYDQLPLTLLDPNDMNPDTPWLSGKNATFKLLEEHPDLTAIIGGNGHITLGAIQAITETGRSIPNDISLIAMELDLSAFEHTVPQITAIDKPLERMFERATELLTKRIKNPDLPLRTVHLPPVLKERQSVKAIN